MNTRAFLLSLAGLWACSAKDPVASTAPERSEASPPSHLPDAQIAAPAPAADSAPATAPRADAPSRADQTPGPARSCAQVSDALLAPGAEDVVLASHARGVQLMAVESGRKSVSLYALTGDGFRRVFSHALEPAIKTLSLVAPSAGPAVLAWVDARAELHVGHLGATGLEHVQRIHDGVDMRFQPALSASDAAPLLLAYTRSVGDAMHTFVAVERGPAFLPSVDVTPLGHGAAAATFVAGRAVPTLYVIDARAGLSPLLEIAFKSGSPAPAIVRTPVSQPATPPLLRAVAWPGSDVHVAYTAIGKLAASAVGHVVATKSDAPTALVPSFGYGELHMDALARKESALLVLEVPDDLPVTAPRHLELVQLDARGEGPHYKLPAHGAARPQLARGTGDEVFVGYVAADGVHIARLRCGS